MLTRFIRRSFKTRGTFATSRPGLVSRSGLRFSAILPYWLLGKQDSGVGSREFAPESVSYPVLGLSELEDGREWSPDRVRRKVGRNLSGGVARSGRAVSSVKFDPRGVEEYSPAPRGNAEFEIFWLPSKAVVCIRRRVRREVLHAKKLSGRVGQRRPHWRDISKIRCVEV